MTSNVKLLSEHSELKDSKLKAQDEVTKLKAYKLKSSNLKAFVLVLESFLFMRIYLYNAEKRQLLRFVPLYRAQ